MPLQCCRIQNTYQMWRRRWRIKYNSIIVDFWWYRAITHSWSWRTGWQLWWWSACGQRIRLCLNSYRGACFNNNRNQIWSGKLTLTIHNVLLTTVSDRFCGYYLSGTTPASAAASVYTLKQPFQIGVKFDGTEIDPNWPTTEYSVGFAIYYAQHFC